MEERGLVVQTTAVKVVRYSCAVVFLVSAVVGFLALVNPMVPSAIALSALVAVFVLRPVATAEGRQVAEQIRGHAAYLESRADSAFVTGRQGGRVLAHSLPWAIATDTMDGWTRAFVDALRSLSSDPEALSEWGAPFPFSVSVRTAPVSGVAWGPGETLETRPHSPEWAADDISAFVEELAVLVAKPRDTGA